MPSLNSRLKPNTRYSGMELNTGRLYRPVKVNCTGCGIFYVISARELLYQFYHGSILTEEERNTVEIISYPIRTVLFHAVDCNCGRHVCSGRRVRL